MAGDQPLTDYEKVRLSRIRENEARLQALGIRSLAASPLLNQPSSSSAAAAAAKRKQKKRSDEADEEYLPSDESGGEEEENGKSSSASDEYDGEETKYSSRSRQKGKKKKLLNSGNSSKSTFIDEGAPVTDFMDDDAALQQAIALSLAEPSQNPVTAMGAETSSTGAKGRKGTPLKNKNTIPIQDSAKNRKTKKQVAEMARLNHENVAKMVGYCKESDPFSRMIVFEYPANGTLYEHLHDGDGCQLSWPRRLKIALSIARVLRHLHTELQPPFAIAALTSSSVYLTEEFSPKIIDFERWRALVAKPFLSSGVVVNGGPLNGAVDPRHMRFMDVQANTFAFGVILLELISGRASLSKDTDELVDWARKHLDQPQEFIKLVDPKLKNVNHENLGIRPIQGPVRAGRLHRAPKN